MKKILVVLVLIVVLLTLTACPPKDENPTMHTVNRCSTALKTGWCEQMLDNINAASTSTVATTEATREKYGR